MFGLLLVIWLLMGIWYVVIFKLFWMDVFCIVVVNVILVVIIIGFVFGDYSMWGYFLIMLFFYFGFIGGCFGFIVGGIKIFCF